MKNKKTINRVLELIRPYTYLVVSILVLAAVTVAATLYSPILIGKGVDCMVEKGLVSFPDLKLVLIQLAVITAISAVSQWVMSLLTNKMTYKIVDDIRRSVIINFKRQSSGVSKNGGRLNVARVCRWYWKFHKIRPWIASFQACFSNPT